MSRASSKSHPRRETWCAGWAAICSRHLEKAAIGARCAGWAAIAMDGVAREAPASRAAWRQGGREDMEGLEHDAAHKAEPVPC